MKPNIKPYLEQLDTEEREITQVAKDVQLTKAHLEMLRKRQRALLDFLELKG